MIEHWEGIKKYFWTTGALPDHVAPEANNWYVTAERFYQDAKVVLPELIEAYRNLRTRYYELLAFAQEAAEYIDLTGPECEDGCECLAHVPEHLECV